MMYTSWLLCLSITILIENVSSLTDIVDTWNDDVGKDYQGTFIDPFTGDGDYWYYPEYKTNRVGDQGGLGNVVSTFNGSQIWGWWSYWIQNINDQTVRDPARSMARYFRCMSNAQVTITIDLYMCATADTTIYYYRQQKAQTGFQIDATRGDNNWNLWGGDVTPGADCSADVRRWQVSDTFTTSGSDDFWFIKISWRGYNNANGASTHTVGFNNLQITCNQIPTKAPTTNPTATTKPPSTTPSKAPSTTPSSTPTKTPSSTPSKSPITNAPTKSPSTPKPSKAPSRPPTTDPTQSPTIDPTADPTPKPTPRPVARPTDPPTAARSLGQQFSDAFGGTGDCSDGWIACNTLVFIILLLIVIFCLLYWILGAVWYKRRQDSRPLPPYLMNQDQNENNVEMGTGGTVATHTTANKWKSEWELEQEQQQQQLIGNQNRSQ